MTINKAVITGNITRDVELRSTGGGLSVANFSVAVNERVKNTSSGEWEDRANFIDCTMFGKRAEALAQYLTKGTKVTVEGRLRWSQWEDKNGGGKRSKIEIVVDELELMTRGEKRTEEPQADLYDADIPFD